MPELPSTSRLEAFSDGVIAVIITIMVLELKVPHPDGFAGLLLILPTLGVYLLSFTFTGVYWVNHHYLVDRLKRVDAFILWANLFFLFFLSLLPFFTSYVLDKHLDSFSVAIYAASLFATGMGFQLLTQAIARNLRVTGQVPSPATIREHKLEIAKGWFSVGSYVAAILLARFHPRIALVLVGFVTVIWIIPDFGVRRHAQCHPPPHPGAATEPRFEN